MANKFVMFLDILGFSQMVSYNEADQLAKIYDCDIRQTAAACSLISASVFKFEERFDVTARESGPLFDVKQGAINLHMMSDSVIAWTNDTTLESLKKICAYAATYIATSFMFGLPHRGAISVGELQLIKLPLNGEPQSNVVGRGVVNAHNFEVGQEWMGCVVDPECLEELSIEDKHEFFRGQPQLVVHYEAPFKESARFRSDLVINWPAASVGGFRNIAYFEEQFSRHNKGSSPGSLVKVNNTYDFYKEFFSGSI